MERLKYWALAGALIFMLALSANSIKVSAQDDADAPSLNLILEIDNLEEQVRQLVNMGLAEYPDPEWFAEKYAYYVALNLAWAERDAEAYEFYAQAMLDVLMEVINEVGARQVPAEAPVDKQGL